MSAATMFRLTIIKTGPKILPPIRICLFISLFTILVAVIHQQVDCWRIINSDRSERYNNEDGDASWSTIAPTSRLATVAAIEDKRTKWKIITSTRSPQTLEDLVLTHKKTLNESEFDTDNVNKSLVYSVKSSKSGKLIEWDDDDLNDADLLVFNPLRDNLLEEPNKSSVEIKFKNQFMNEENNNNLSNQKNGKNQNKVSHTKSRMIYHGQLKRNNTRVRIADNIELDINTHKPVAINRRSFNSAPSTIGSWSMPKSSSWLDLTTTRKPINDALYLEASTPSVRVSDEDKDVATTMKPSDKNSWNSLVQTNTQDASESNWRPIVVSSIRSRRSGRTQISKTRNFSDLNLDKFGDNKLNMDYKWKPISKQSADRVILDLSKEIVRMPLVDESMKQSTSSSSSIRDRKKSRLSMLKFEEPFDNLDDANLNNDDNDNDGVDYESRMRKSLKNHNEPTTVKPKDRDETIRWRPLETSTSSSDLSIESTTTVESIAKESITTAAPFSLINRLNSTAATANNQSHFNNSQGFESAQRSASDLNYIYSSQPAGAQPQAQPQVASTQTSGSSYYSNYLVQPTVVDQSSSLQPGPIIDTTSGQTPEMIADRTPEVSAPQQDSYYSLPQTVGSAFQPALAPPSRAPSTYYNSNNYAYDTSSYTSVANSFRSQPQPTQPPVRQAPAPTAAPIIRQEHHYHYYNQQAQSAPDRSQPSSSLQTVTQQPTIIRELQPIMISQPIVQQQAPTSTTPQPPTSLQTQIIREVVREVPIQSVSPMQLPTRVILQQQPVQITMAALPSPSPPLSQQVPQPALPMILRDSSLDLYETPAKRLMRQITSNIPQVAIRMPNMPNMSQFRTQIPIIQMPQAQLVRDTNRNLASVTRQTGSFITPPMPKKTTTFMTETQAMPVHTTIMHTTQFTPATRTTVYTTDHQPLVNSASSGYR